MQIFVIFFFYGILFAGLDYWSNFPYTSKPVLARGGNYNNNVIAGLAAFGHESGDIFSNIGFRPVLATL